MLQDDEVWLAFSLPFESGMPVVFANEQLERLQPKLRSRSYLGCRLIGTAPVLFNL
jgi:hypothetical protein